MSTSPMEVPEEEGFGDDLNTVGTAEAQNRVWCVQCADWIDQAVAHDTDHRRIAEGDLAGFAARLRAEEQRRIAMGLNEFVVDDPEIGRDYGFNAGLQQARWVVTSGFIAGAAVPVATRGPLDFEALAAEALAGIKTAYIAAGRDVESEAFRMHLAAKVAEEGAEALAAYLHATGWARRPGTWEQQFDAELADTVISAFLAATANGRDLNAAIAAKHAIVMSRGFKEPVVALRDVVRASTCNHTVEEGCTGHGDF